MEKYYGSLNSKAKVLEALINQRVTLILTNGLRIEATVNSVNDSILFTSARNKFMIINIECISVISTCCEEMMESVLNNIRNTSIIHPEL